MIQDGVMFVSFLLAFTALIAVVEKKIGGKFFKYVPGIVLNLYWSGSDENIRGLFR